MPGRDCYSVAENETLDLRKHARWNRARRLLGNGVSAEEISIEIRRCDEKTFARLHKLMPLTDLIAAIRSPWGSPELLLVDCKDAAEYAETIIQIGQLHREPEAMFLELGKRMVDIFFDQERQRLDLRGDGSAFRSLEMRRFEVSRAILPGLRDIAEQQAAFVSGERNRPPKPTVPRESQEQILTHSLR